jgi:hypothetical protein
MTGRNRARTLRAEKVAAADSEIKSESAAVPSLPAEEEKPSGEAPREDESEPAISVEDLPPLVPPSVADAKGKKKRGRPPSGLSKAERRKLAKERKEQREQRDKALAAIGGATVSDAPAQALQGTNADRELTQAAPTDPALAAMCGLGADMIARYMPTKYGGGKLDDEEKKMLGDVWAAALIPYLDGPSSAMGVAAICTVQVFAMRAMTNADKKADEVKSPPVPPGAMSEEVQSPIGKSEDAPVAPIARAMAKQEGRRVRIPQYTGAD